jgi:hypothetical protein
MYIARTPSYTDLASSRHAEFLIVGIVKDCMAGFRLFASGACFPPEGGLAANTITKLKPSRTEAWKKGRTSD